MAAKNFIASLGLYNNKVSVYAAVINAARSYALRCWLSTILKTRFVEAENHHSVIAVSVKHDVVKNS